MKTNMIALPALFGAALMFANGNNPSAVANQTGTTTSVDAPRMEVDGLGDTRSAAVLYKLQASLAATKRLVAQKVKGEEGRTILTANASHGEAAAAAAASYNVIKQMLDSAPAGSTVNLPAGEFSAPAGTTIVVMQPLTVIGNGTTLINIRLLFASNVTLSNVTFKEVDCVFHSYAPEACSPATPLVTIGYPGYPITMAKLTKINMEFGRAYTGIAFGLDRTDNITIDGFNMIDNEMSAITGFGGRNIRISNGVMKGGNTQNVDDGVALYAVYDDMSDVVVENIKADNVFDAVGIGALMYRPLKDVLVRNVSCVETAVCVYIKAGDQAPVPSGFGKYSELSRLTVAGVKDSDPSGKRYLSSIWMYAKGGAVARDITVSGVEAITRSVAAYNARIRVFSDDESKIQGFNVQDSVFTDTYRGAATGANKPGAPLTEGIFIQSLGTAGISDVTFTGVRIDGATHFGVDSVNAKVENLSIERSEFTNMNVANANGPVFLIPYEFKLDGQVVRN